MFQDLTRSFEHTYNMIITIVVRAERIKELNFASGDGLWYVAITMLRFNKSRFHCQVQ